MDHQPFTILALDSSTSACSVALRRDGAPLCCLRSDGRGQAEAMLPLVADLMRHAGLAWSAIDLIGVTVGPGSFTGLRIGLAAARGLALATGTPISGVSTAALIAAMVPAAMLGGRRLLVAIDSKRDDLFLQVFSASRQADGDLRALTPEQALLWQTGPLLVAGDAAGHFEGLRPDIVTYPCLPDAERLADLAETLWRQGQALPAQPLYLRPPDVSLPRQ